MAVLEINNIRKSFRGREVLKDISISVEEGEVIAILGPSGSGKSTLLRCATMLETMDDGSLDFRTHFFMGGMIVDGELVRIQKIDPDVCLEITRQMLSHCCHERVNVENVLPELYERRAEFDISAAETMQADMRIMR